MTSIMLLGSPPGLMLIPDRKRLALADDLDVYATAGERQPNIRCRAARRQVQERLELNGGAWIDRYGSFSRDLRHRRPRSART